MFPPLRNESKKTKQKQTKTKCPSDFLYSFLFSRFNQLKATGLTVNMPDSLLGFVDSCGSSGSLWDLQTALNLNHPVSQLSQK